MNDNKPFDVEPVVCIESCIVIGEQPCTFETHRLVIQSADVLPVNVLLTPVTLKLPPLLFTKIISPVLGLYVPPVTLMSDANILRF